MLTKEHEFIQDIEKITEKMPDVCVCRGRHMVNDFYASHIYHLIKKFKVSCADTKNINESVSYALKISKLLDQL